MTVTVNKFGDILMSRPDGKEAFLMAKAYILDSVKPEETISLDFANVKVLAPSWADEFITGLKTSFKNNLEYLNTDNESVSASLKTVLK